MSKLLDSNTALNQIERLDPALIGNSRTTQLSLMTISILAAIVLLSFAFAVITNIDEVASAPGVVTPIGKNQIIQHLEGGIVAEILATNGDKVRKGQTLLTLNPVQTTAQHESLLSKEIALRLDLIRLDAFINQKLITSTGIQQHFSALGYKDIEQYQPLITQTLDFLIEQKASREQQIGLLEQQVNQFQNELNHVQKRIDNRKSRLAILEKSKKIYETLGKSDAVSKVSLMQAYERYNETEGELLETLAEAEQIRGQFTVAQKKVSALNSRYQEQSRQEMNEASAELIALQKRLTNYSDQVDRLKIEATASGIVAGLDLDIGSVIAPGSTILEIVPQDKQLIIEAQIDNKDIGHIHLGDEAKIKVNTYHFVRYGTLKGSVKSISASSYLNKQGIPYYKAEIVLDHAQLGFNPKAYPLKSGMTVTSDIVTGQKSLISYMLKPIQRSMHTAFRER